MTSIAIVAAVAAAMSVSVGVNTKPKENPLVTVDPPDAALASVPIVATTRPSVLKIRGEAASCQKVFENSGFVVAPNRVMSTAAAVAGVTTVTVQDGDHTYDAHVVSYDPNADISILEVPDLPAAPLAFDLQDASQGTDAIVLGYPGGGDFKAAAARMREVIELNGPDIYHTTAVTRQVDTIRGAVHQGNSGGPLIGRDGKVLGVVLGTSVIDPDTGFVLTAKEVLRQMQRVTNTQPVSTGTCVTQGRGEDVTQAQEGDFVPAIGAVPDTGGSAVVVVPPPPPGS